MQQLKTDDATKQLGRFFGVAFLWSWLLWIPRVLASASVIRLPVAVDFTLGVLAVFGPGFSAFCLTRSSSGKAGVKELWLRGWRLDFDKFWLIPAVLVMPVIGGLTVLILMGLRVEIPWEYSLPTAMIAPIFLMIYLSAMGEEYGWRGYAQDRLQTLLSPLQASLLLGAIWGFWHLPLHFIFGTTQSVIPMWQIILQSMALAILYTWLYNKSRRSILVVTIFHAFSNLTGALLPTWVSNTGRWINILLIIVAIVTLAMLTGLRRYRQSK